MSVFSPNDGQTLTDLCCSGSRPCFLCAVAREYGQGAPTDVSPHLISISRESGFPIDFSADKHHILTSNPSNVHAFATDQANLLACGRPIAMELIHHHRTYHREHINPCRPSPCIYNKGDFFFAKHSVNPVKNLSPQVEL